MSQNLTLHSRLKILIAKTFRAEKLYGTIRNTQSGQSGHLNTITEIANDVRAREWQRSHFHFRTALNDLLAESSASALGASVAELQQIFQRRATESSQALTTGTAALEEATKRSEFAHVMKLAVELIRHRARAQANQVIADELAAVLDATLSPASASAKQPVAKPLEETPTVADAEHVENRPSNVIPLTRKVAAGGRHSRR